ncbi:putative oxidoreductase TM_0325 [Branchiostoma floridae x Branchiostoma belcheri]
MPDFRGKVAIITGASAGIGKGTAVEFAQLGAHLALTGRNQENLQTTAKACVEAGTPEDKILLVTGDISDDELRKNLVDQTAHKFGRIDVLVNNAGTLTFGNLEATDMAVYDKTMDVNVRSVFPDPLAYNISKSAVDQFTRCVALELAPKQIRVNSVNPGVIRTDIFQNSGMTEEECAKFYEHHKTTHALGRVGEVPEVAKTIAFLASPDASFITGAQVPVDGGRHCICPR